MKKVISIGITFITLGLGFLMYFYINVHKPGQDAKLLLTKGISVYEMGDRRSINKAIELFREVIVNDRYEDTDSRIHALYHMAYCLEKLHQYQLAYFKYVSLLQLNNRISPKMINEIKVRLAHLKLKYEYSEEGLHQLYSLLNNSTDKKFRSRVYSEIGLSYLRGKKYTKALKMFTFALYEFGENEEAMIGKARTYKHLGRYNDAFDSYEKFLKFFGVRSAYALSVRRTYIREVYGRGIYLHQQGRYSSSIRFFHRLLNFYPHIRLSENSLYWIGESYFKKKNYITALRYFGRTLSNNYSHKNQAARIKRGYCYFMMKNYDLAAREFQIYLNHYPRGRYRHTARQWKKMTKKEIIYRLNKNHSPEKKQEIESDKNDNSEITHSLKKDKSTIKPIVSKIRETLDSITEL